jgi:hypothetical protein
VNHLPDATFLALTNSERAEDRAWFEARDFAFHVEREMVLEDLPPICEEEQ